MIFTPSDRRRHPRVYLELDYRFFSSDGEHLGKTNNISLSGAFLHAPEPDLAMSAVSQIGKLEIKLKDDHWLSFKCEVVYIAGNNDQGLPIGAGVAFCDTDDETGRSLMELADAIED